MNTRKGFTLVELLVVIAILAILATVSVVGYTAFIQGAEEQAAITEADQIKGTIDAGLTLDKYIDINGTVYTRSSGKLVVYTGDDDNADNTFKATDIDETTAAKIQVVKVGDADTVVYHSGDYYVDLNTGKLVKVTE